MKKVTIITFLFISCFTIHAQNKALLEKNIALLYESTVNGDYGDALDYTYPRVFEIVPRETLKNAMESTFDTEGFTITVINVPPEFEFKEIIEIDGGYYCLAYHNLSMKMAFEEKIPTESVDILISGMKNAMEAKEVSFNAEENAITILKRAELIAAADSYSDMNWTFINNEKGKFQMRDMLFSNEILTALGLR